MIDIIVTFASNSYVHAVFSLQLKEFGSLSCREEEKLTEVTVADKLAEFRSKQEV